MRSRGLEKGATLINKMFRFLKLKLRFILLSLFFILGFNISKSVSVYAGLYTKGIPDTGQTTCYNGTTNITCGGSDYPNQDADHVGNAPSYTIVLNTVVDNNTSKVWQRYGHGSSDGYTVPSAVDNCTTNGTYASSYCAYVWQDALKYCYNLTLDGKLDWRLPNIKELQSIVDHEVWSPSINTTSFLYTKSGYYWSSTTYSAILSYAWDFLFVGGSVSSGAKSTSYYVRCVRGD